MFDEELEEDKRDEEYYEKQLIIASNALAMLTDEYLPCDSTYEADMHCNTLYLAKQMEAIWPGCYDTIMEYLPDMLTEAGFKSAVIHDFNEPTIKWLFKKKTQETNQ